MLIKIFAKLIKDINGNVKYIDVRFLYCCSFVMTKPKLFYRFKYVAIYYFSIRVLLETSRYEISFLCDTIYLFNLFFHYWENIWSEIN